VTGPLEARLRERRDAGRKLLVPYVTGGLGADWVDVVRAFAANGADAIEIGLPFSDPVMDGPTIQEASSTPAPRRSGSSTRCRRWTSTSPSWR
jgi:tryptophan synthase alpha chain